MSEAIKQHSDNHCQRCKLAHHMPHVSHTCTCTCISQPHGSELTMQSQLQAILQSPFMSGLCMYLGTYTATDANCNALVPPISAFWPVL